MNHRPYLVLINPTKLIFCPIFEGDATRRGGWRVDSGGPTGGGDRGRWPIRGCYAIKLPPILLGHPTLTLSLVFVYVSVFVFVLVYVCLRCVPVARTNERLLRTWPPFNQPASMNPFTLLWLWIKREKCWQRNRTSASVYLSVHLQSLRIRPSQNIWVCSMYTKIKGSHYDYDDLEHKS